jgi:hypothetical protein
MPTADESIKRLVISVLILLVSGTILGATGWNFNKVAKMPEVYVKKIDIAEFERNNREDHQMIEQKLDHLLELILEHRTFDPPTNSNYEEN